MHHCAQMLQDGLGKRGRVGDIGIDAWVEDRHGQLRNEGEFHDDNMTRKDYSAVVFSSVARVAFVATGVHLNE